MASPTPRDDAYSLSGELMILVKATGAAIAPVAFSIDTTRAVVTVDGESFASDRFDAYGLIRAMMMRLRCLAERRPESA